jgi:hypothetical protein
MRNSPSFLCRENLFADPIDTMTIEGRYRVFITVVNIFRLLRSMRRSFPEQTIQLYREYERPGGVKVGVLLINSMILYYH